LLEIHYFIEFTIKDFVKTSDIHKYGVDC